MTDAFHRILTGQALTQRQLQIGGVVVLFWIAIDIIQFVGWLFEKLAPVVHCAGN
jgi:hypothetical protein